MDGMDGMVEIFRIKYASIRQFIKKPTNEKLFLTFGKMNFLNCLEHHLSADCYFLTIIAGENNANTWKR